MFQFANQLAAFLGMFPWMYTPTKYFVYGLEWVDTDILHCRFKGFCQTIQILSYSFTIRDLEMDIENGDIEFRELTLEELDSLYEALDEDDDVTDSAA